MEETKTQSLTPLYPDYPFGTQLRLALYCAGDNGSCGAIKVHSYRNGDQLVPTGWWCARCCRAAGDIEEVVDFGRYVPGQAAPFSPPPILSTEEQFDCIRSVKLAEELANGSRHPTDLYVKLFDPDGSQVGLVRIDTNQYQLDELVRAIGDLRYDVLAGLLDRLAVKLASDSTQDRLRGRPILGARLRQASTAVDRAAHRIRAAWRICEGR